MRNLRLYALRFLALAGALTILVIATPLVRWWTLFLSNPWEQPTGDVLIVLGGDSHRLGDVLGESSYWRAAFAVRIWREGHFRQIVLSGGGQPPISMQMKDYLVGHGVPEAVIITETGSNTTRENALGVGALAAKIPGRKVLLTSEFHQFRAIRALRRAGIDAAPLAVPDILIREQSWPRRVPAFADLMLEMTKIGWYWLRGWI